MINYRKKELFGFSINPAHDTFIWKDTEHGPEIKSDEPWWKIRWLKCFANGQERCGTHFWIYTKWGAMLFCWGYPKMTKAGVWSK